MVELRSFATTRQQEYLDAISVFGSMEEAAASLGVAKTTIERSLRSLKMVAAQCGHAPGHFTGGVAPGYRMGKVTIQRGKEGEVERVWERQSPDDALYEQMLKDFAATLADSVKGIAPAVPFTQAADEDLLCVIPVGDPHFGLYTWAGDAEKDFSLEEAERVTCAAVDRLVDSGPAAKTGLLLNLGDHFHADNQKNQSQSGHQLDVAGRWAEIQQVSVRAMVYCIKKMLTKYEQVVVKINRGNHDKHASYALSLMLSCYFHNEPRVHVDLCPKAHWYYQFGKVLIGSTHGDTTKDKDLLPTMAVDKAVAWGQAKHRYWYVGHLHHKQVKEFHGGIVEYFRTLAPGDAWHYAEGYRSGHDLNLIVHHKEHGEVERHRVDTGMLEKFSG